MNCWKLGKEECCRENIEKLRKKELGEDDWERTSEAVSETVKEV